MSTTSAPLAASTASASSAGSAGSRSRVKLGELGIHAAFGEGVEEAGHLGWGDVRGAAALITRGACEFADDRDLGIAGDRKDGIIVLEQHHGFDGRLMRDFVVSFDVES